MHTRVGSSGNPSVGDKTATNIILANVSLKGGVCVRACVCAPTAGHTFSDVVNNNIEVDNP